MSYSVHIKPSGLNLTVKADETVLAAALRQNFKFPHACRNGLCGTCRGKILDGHVDYSDKTIYALTEEDREAGLALFCSAKPTTDLIIHVDGVEGPEQLALKTVTCEVKEITPLAATIWQVFLQLPEHSRVSYKAGQYLEILHRDTSPKPFSIANMPRSNGIIELHIRQQPGNDYVQFLLEELRQRKKLRVRLPLGGCIYPKEPDVPTILLAGGTGFAPIKAIVEQALTEGLAQPFYLYWGARNRSELYLYHLPEQWAKIHPMFHYIPVLSAPLPEDRWQGRMGYVHEAVVQDHSDLKHFQVYASGPPEMVYAALRAFQAQGLNKTYMYSDVFDYEGM